MNAIFAPTPDQGVQAAQQRIARELSQGSRTTTVLLLIAASLATATVASLWLSEVGLPLRTQIAFAMLTAIGLGWSTFFTWVLTRRRPLFAYHRVVAGRMAVAATSLFTIGALTLAMVFPDLTKTGLAAAGLGAAMVVAAIFLLRSASRQHADLLQLRVALEAQLS